MTRVVITGYGSTTPFNENPKEWFFANNLSGTNRTSDRVCDLHLKECLERRNLRQLDRTSQLLASAAGKALGAAGLHGQSAATIGLINGTLFSSGKTISAFDCRALEEGPSFASALDFANTVINASTGQTAICFALAAENTTISTGLSSGLKAISRAVDSIRCGRSETLLAGGVEELSDDLRLAFQESKMLASDGAMALPWSQPAGGMRLSEGAALVVIESESSAIDRDAAILAEVIGVGSAFDVSGRSRVEASVKSIVHAISLALADGRCRPQDVDCVIASANGSAADLHECHALRHVFDNQSLPHVFAPKEFIGESLGAGGPLQIISAMELLGNRNLQASIQQLAMHDCFAGCRCKSTGVPPWRLILINSISYDGHSCSVLLRQFVRRRNDLN